MSIISQFGDAGSGQHISEQELSALLKQHLTPVQNLRLQQHLTDCLPCQELYQDANNFCLARRPEEPVLNEVQIQQSWEQLKPLLLQSPSPTAVRVTHRPTTWADTANLKRDWALPLAAILFLSLGILTITLWRNRQATALPAGVASNTPDVISKPTANQPTPSANQPAVIVPQSIQKSATSKTTTETTRKPLSLGTYEVATLMLTSGERNATEPITSPPLSIPAEAAQLRFRIIRYKPTEFPAYQVELLNAAGEVKQVVRGSLAKTKMIEAVFHRAGLTDGEYQLRVTGQGRENADLLPLTTPPVKLSFQAH